MAEALTVNISNKTEIRSNARFHKAFGINFRLTSTGASNYNDFTVGISGTSSVRSGWNPHILFTSNGSISGTTITDIDLPTDGILDMFVMVDQCAALAGEHEDLLYEVSASHGATLGTPDTTTSVDVAEEFDDSGGYNKNEETFGPGIVYIDKKLVGITTPDGVTPSRMFEVNDVLSNDVLGPIGAIPTREGYGLKLAMNQMTLQNFRTFWGIRSTNFDGNAQPYTSTTVNILGTSYANAEVLDLIPVSQGFLDESHVVVKVPRRKDGKILVFEFFAMTIKNPGDLVIKQDSPMALTADLSAHCTADPDNSISGRIYLLDPSALQ